MGRILVNDLGRQVGAGEIRDAVERVIASGWYVLGQECAMFEREFADYCGTAFCIGVGNGTDALELSFRALGLANKRVATVANAGFYSTTALVAAGAFPVYVDVDPERQLMDLDGLAALAAAGELDAVVVTHLFGLMHDMQAILSIADAASIPVIEDCAQAHGARRNGRRAGSFGDIACFSFYPTKNLGALGDGGAIVTDDPELAARLSALRQYCWEGKYRVMSPGGRNSRLDEIQAAVLRAKLPRLDAGNARRREIAARYTEGIEHPGIVCPPLRGEDYVAHLYVVTCDDPAGLRSHLAAADIATDVHYPIPDHLQPAFAARERRLSLPVTETLAAQVVTLPCFPELTDEEADRVIHHVNSWRR